MAEPATAKRSRKPSYKNQPQPGDDEDDDKEDDEPEPPKNNKRKSTGATSKKAPAAKKTKSTTTTTTTAKKVKKAVTVQEPAEVVNVESSSESSDDAVVENDALRTQRRAAKLELTRMKINTASAISTEVITLGFTTRPHTVPIDWLKDDLKLKTNEAILGKSTTTPEPRASLTLLNRYSVYRVERPVLRALPSAGHRDEAWLDQRTRRHVLLQVQEISVSPYLCIRSFFILTFILIRNHPGVSCSRYDNSTSCEGSARITVGP